MKTAITTTNPAQIAIMNDLMQQAGQAARVAFEDHTAAGAISAEESILIASVEGYTNKEAKNIDTKRRGDDLNTRRSNKKAEAVTIFSH